MSPRLWMVVVGMVLAFSAAVLAQSTGNARSVPPTPWGHPNLQGVWDFRTVTPIERPADQADKSFPTEEEAAALEAQGAARRERLLEPSEVRCHDGNYGLLNVLRGARTEKLADADTR